MAAGSPGAGSQPRRSAFFSLFAARFSSGVRAGFFFCSFFLSMPLLIESSPRPAAELRSVPRQGNPVTLDLTIQRVAADAQLRRDVTHDPVVLLYDPQECFAFGVFQ